ncbi:MAG: hypothetical protein SVK08_13335 [Halobacteriota archaeon]|nr:hypothetical protein [Halobacteriota archaeon]
MYRVLTNSGYKHVRDVSMSDKVMAPDGGVGVKSKKKVKATIFEIDIGGANVYLPDFITIITDAGEVPASRLIKGITLKWYGRISSKVISHKVFKKNESVDILEVNGIIFIEGMLARITP